ncbi:hypothetical protein BU25DRAFT_412789, partial [Macroventuria anomochaeta]
MHFPGSRVAASCMSQAAYLLPVFSCQHERGAATLRDESGGWQAVNDSPKAANGPSIAVRAGGPRATASSSGFEWSEHTFTGL